MEKLQVHSMIKEPCQMRYRNRHLTSRRRPAPSIGTTRTERAGVRTRDSQRACVHAHARGSAVLLSDVSRTAIARTMNQTAPVSCIPAGKMSKAKKVLDEAREIQNPELDLADKGIATFEEMPGLRESSHPTRLRARAKLGNLSRQLVSSTRLAQPRPSARPDHVGVRARARALSF